MVNHTGHIVISLSSSKSRTEQCLRVSSSLDGRPYLHTLRHRVTIWVVRVGDDLFVRAVNGRTSAWFRGAQVRHEGRIWAGGIEKDVTFLEVSDPDLSDRIDAAYLTKYRRNPQYVAPMVTPEVRAATIKLVPH
jgi:hypothetical protein